MSADLQKIFKETVQDVYAIYRKKAIEEENGQIKSEKSKEIKFYKLSTSDMKKLQKLSKSTHKKYAKEINRVYSGDTYKPANYLKEVQDFMGYK